ncbi:hypothetical protein BJY59DRAFT_687148 [Rhodotorula toruloides]
MLRSPSPPTTQVDLVLLYFLIPKAASRRLLHGDGEIQRADSRRCLRGCGMGRTCSVRACSSLHLPFARSLSLPSEQDDTSNAECSLHGAGNRAALTAMYGQAILRLDCACLPALDGRTAAN